MLNILIRGEIIVALLNSVQKNQQILLTYFSQKKPNIEKSNEILKTIVIDYSFGKKLIVVLKILNLINQYQHIFETENYKLYLITTVGNKIRFHLYYMTNEAEKADLHHIAEMIGENRYLKQSNNFHVIAALLLSKNHGIKMIDVTTENSFINTMHRFFEKYASFEKISQAMKNGLFFRNKKKRFHITADCGKYDNDSELFGKICRSFVSILNVLTHKVMLLSKNSVLVEKSGSAMNLIMNKIRNTLTAVNVDKLMFIHMNECALHRSKKKNKQQSDKNEDINEKYLCQMKNELLQQDTILFESQHASEFFKRPISQQLIDDAMKKGTKIKII